MATPWAKKNPFMSLWLSGANTVMATARGRAAIEAQRQATQMMTRSVEEMGRFWTGALWAPPRKRKNRR